MQNITDCRKGTLAMADNSIQGQIRWYLQVPDISDILASGRTGIFQLPLDDL